MILDIGVTVAAILTIMIWSVLYKHTIIYRLVEHIFIGTMAGYYIGYYARIFIVQAWNPLLDGKLGGEN